MLKKEKKVVVTKPLSKKKTAIKKLEELASSVVFEVENRAYEVMFVLDSDLSEKKRDEKINEIKSSITALGGEVTFEDLTWGTRKLCYKIKGKWFGFYYLLNFKLDPRELIEVSKQWNIDNEILRNLVVKMPANYVPKPYTELKDKYEVESFEEKKEKNLIKKKKQQQKKDELKKEPVLVEKKDEEVIAVKSEVKAVVKDEVAKEVVGKDEVEKAEKVKKEDSVETIKESSADDHLKELNDKLDKLLLSDDITNL